MPPWQVLFGGCSAASQLETVVVCKCVCGCVFVCLLSVCKSQLCLCVCVSVVAVSVCGEVVTKKELRVGDGFKRKRDVGKAKENRKLVEIKKTSTRMKRK